MIDLQLELRFENARGRRVVNPRRSGSRARWWFARMREVVDQAVDWQPVSKPRPEQTWFPVPPSRAMNRADSRDIFLSELGMNC
jgi:hypothetical protein